MNALLIYGYSPGTTAWYLERAFQPTHGVLYAGPPAAGRTGGLADADLSDLLPALEKRPDLILYVDSPGFCFPRGMERMEIPTACYLIDVYRHLPYYLNVAALFDYTFAAQKDYLGQFLRVNPNSFWLPVACDPEIHRQRPVERTLEVGFVGHMIPSRRAVLDRLSSRFMMNPYATPVPFEEITGIYSRSKIVVNLPVHGDLNMRVFEAMACGSLVVTQEIQNGQRELFRDREHLVTYRRTDELETLIDYYLKHDDERRRIAAAGQALTLASHTYRHRAQALLESIGESRLCAPARSQTKGEVSARYARIYSNKGMLLSAWKALVKVPPFEALSMGAYAHFAKALWNRMFGGG